jgi:2-hydroxy-6-oxonona-2,4-dienedioate hydrolase
MSDVRMNSPPPTSLWLDLERVAFRQDYINAGGVRTRILSAGSTDKPLLLFMHGTGGHAEAYTRNLGAHAKHFWVVAFDAIGHGWTDKPATDYEIPTYAEHARAVIAALGRNSAHLSGESLGGWTATYLAIHHPGLVDRLVLNTAGGWTAHPAVMARIKELSLAAAENPTFDLLRARLEFLMYDKSMVNDDLVNTRRSIYAQPEFLETTKRILCLQEMEIRRRNMFSRENYSAIRAPTLVLWTTHDPTASVDEGREIASMIPGSRFVVMENCGHWPQFEAPDEFNRIHLDFLLDKQ